MGKEKMTKLEKQWVLYDVGNSAFVMLVSTIIPIYFKNMATASGISAANSTAYLSYAIFLLLFHSKGMLIFAVFRAVFPVFTDEPHRQ